MPQIKTKSRTHRQVINTIEQEFSLTCSVVEVEAVFRGLDKLARERGPYSVTARNMVKALRKSGVSAFIK